MSAAVVKLQLPPTAVTVPSCVAPSRIATVLPASAVPVSDTVLSLVMWSLS